MEQHEKKQPTSKCYFFMSYRRSHWDKLVSFFRRGLFRLLLVRTSARAKEASNHCSSSDHRSAVPKGKMGALSAITNRVFS